MKVRISKTFMSFLEGSGFAQCGASRPDGKQSECNQGCQPSDHDLWRRIMDAPERKDGSCTVEVDEYDLKGLIGYADVMAIGAGDNLGPWGDPGALGEYNAGRAFIRQAEKLGVRG